MTDSVTPSSPQTRRAASDLILAIKKALTANSTDVPDSAAIEAVTTAIANAFNAHRADEDIHCPEEDPDPQTQKLLVKDTTDGGKPRWMKALVDFRNLLLTWKLVDIPRLASSSANYDTFYRDSGDAPEVAVLVTKESGSTRARFRIRGSVVVHYILRQAHDTNGNPVGSPVVILPSDISITNSGLTGVPFVTDETGNVVMTNGQPTLTPDNNYAGQLTDLYFSTETTTLWNYSWKLVFTMCSIGKGSSLTATETLAIALKNSYKDQHLVNDKREPLQITDDMDDPNATMNKAHKHHHDNRYVKLNQLTSGKGMFEIFYSSCTKTPDGAYPLWKSNTISATSQPTFCAMAKDMADKGLLRSVTQEVWDAEVSSTGQCGGFVITMDGSTVVSVRLPLVKTFLRGLDTTQDTAVTETVNGVTRTVGYTNPQQGASNARVDPRPHYHVTGYQSWGYHDIWVFTNRNGQSTLPNVPVMTRQIGPLPNFENRAWHMDWSGYAASASRQDALWSGNTVTFAPSGTSTTDDTTDTHEVAWTANDLPDTDYPVTDPAPSNVQFGLYIQVFNAVAASSVYSLDGLHGEMATLTSAVNALVAKIDKSDLDHSNIIALTDQTITGNYKAQITKNLSAMYNERYVASCPGMLTISTMNNDSYRPLVLDILYDPTCTTWADWNSTDIAYNGRGTLYNGYTFIRQPYLYIESGKVKGKRVVVSGYSITGSTITELIPTGAKFRVWADDAASDFATTIAFTPSGLFNSLPTLGVLDGNRLVRGMAASAQAKILYWTNLTPEKPKGDVRNLYNYSAFDSCLIPAPKAYVVSGKQVLTKETPVHTYGLSDFVVTNTGTTLNTSTKASIQSKYIPNGVEKGDYAQMFTNKASINVKHATAGTATTYECTWNVDSQNKANGSLGDSLAYDADHKFRLTLKRVLTSSGNSDLEVSYNGSGAGLQGFLWEATETNGAKAFQDNMIPTLSAGGDANSGTFAVPAGQTYWIPIFFDDYLGNGAHQHRYHLFLEIQNVASTEATVSLLFVGDYRNCAQNAHYALGGTQVVRLDINKWQIEKV